MLLTGAALAPQEAPPLASVPAQPSGIQLTAAEIRLPQVFVGCWKSVTRHANEGVESIRTTGPYAWFLECVIPPGTTEFCYKQSADGSFQPTMFAMAVTDDWVARQQMTDQSYKLEVLATDGRHTARLRGHSHHVEFGKRFLDESWELNCSIKGDSMACVDEGQGTVNGKPWCFSKTHYVFTRVEE